MDDEVSVSLRNITGKTCMPKCYSDNSCPQDVNKNSNYFNIYNF
jgi:hypothetical protein